MKKQEEPRRFESETLGLPPLKMVLVHTDGEGGDRLAKKDSAPHKIKKNRDNLQAIVKLIDHLIESD